MRWPSFTGELLLEPEAISRAGYGDDFGRLITTRPRAVLRAGSVHDVQEAMRHAQAMGMAVVARGQGHTTRGQSQTDGGLVLDLRGLSFIEAPRAGAVRVGAGASWTEVVTRMFTEGLTPPVLTDYLDLSVAGTLSVGGVGGQSFRHGLQVDNVIALDVVCGTGELVHCSTEVDRELFDACRGGLGHFGVIVAATLALRPAPQHVRVSHIGFADLSEFSAGQLALARSGTFDYLVGNLLPDASADLGWALSVECVEYSPDANDGGQTMGYLDYVTRLRHMVEAWRQSGSWSSSHPWIDLFLPRDALASIVSLALDGFGAQELGDGYVMTYPLLSHATRTCSPSWPASDELFLFDILPAMPRERPDLRREFETRCRTILAAALDAGATVYPIGYPLGTADADPSMWRHLLGPRWEGLRATRQRVDPGGICNPALAMLATSSGG